MLMLIDITLYGICAIQIIVIIIINKATIHDRSVTVWKEHIRLSLYKSQVTHQARAYLWKTMGC